ncbi:hypothetical protein A2U01_0071436, partial [Trifolium medium]|nr:hypothetical protein [Trifolium medium]
MASAPPHMNSQAAMHTSFISPPDDQWYVDNGATSHMTGNE